MCPSASQAMTGCERESEAHRAPRILTTLPAAGGIVSWAESSVLERKFAISLIYGTNWHRCQEQGRHWQRPPTLRARSGAGEDATPEPGRDAIEFCWAAGQPI